MVKNAMDIGIGERLIPDPEDGRIVIIDYITEDEDGLYVEGYYEDNGDEYQDLLEYDDEVQVTKE